MTVFPCSLARAASFDLDIERGVAATTQREARAKWNMYLHVTNHTPAYNSEGLSLTLYAPEMNLCRDPVSVVPSPTPQFPNHDSQM